MTNHRWESDGKGHFSLFFSKSLNISKYNNLNCPRLDIKHCKDKFSISEICSSEVSHRTFPSDSHRSSEVQSSNATNVKKIER